MISKQILIFKESANKFEAKYETTKISFFFFFNNNNNETKRYWYKNNPKISKAFAAAFLERVSALLTAIEFPKKLPPKIKIIAEVIIIIIIISTDNPKFSEVISGGDHQGWGPASK